MFMRRAVGLICARATMGFYVCRYTVTRRFTSTTPPSTTGNHDGRRCQPSVGTDIFCRIARGEAPCTLRHSDDLCIAFNDLYPAAPVHVLVVPRKHISGISTLSIEEDSSLMGHLISVAKQLADKMGLDRGYRLVFNNGPFAGQSVGHVHLHLLGGRPFKWPPG